MFLIFSCSSVTVKTDHDPEYDFSKFKTYRWASAEEINPDDELAKYPLVYKRVQASVDRELEARGFSRVESGEVDFVVLAHAGVKDKMQVHSTGYYGGWYDPWWGPYGGSTSVSYYEEGTLVVDVISRQNKELAWRGVGTKALSDNPNAEKVQREVDLIVTKILKDFPPPYTN
jgi:hypothetical protein